MLVPLIQGNPGWNETHKFPLCVFQMRGSGADIALCEQTIRKDTSLRNLLGEAICDKSDALIVVWNEDVMELSGATWELMRIAYDRKIPCIWISTKAQQNNYSYNLKNHENMLTRLGAMRERVTRALEQEELPMEMFDILIMEFAELMLVEDTIGWQHQYMNLSVKPL